jgi:hypothetical protein
MNPDAQLGALDEGTLDLGLMGPLPPERQSYRILCGNRRGPGGPAALAGRLGSNLDEVLRSLYAVIAVLLVAAASQAGPGNRPGPGPIFAAALVYFLLVINFELWTDPFIIFTALPGGFVGIVWMLFLTHTTFNVESMTGLGEGGEQNAPLGRAAIRGFLLMTVAALFFVPVVSSMLRHKARPRTADDDFHSEETTLASASNSRREIQ